MIAARLAGIARGAGTFTATISAPLSSLNLYTWALANGYGGSGDGDITINTGVDMGPVVPGAWPGGKLKLTIKGTVNGNPGSAGGGVGGAGGTALDASSVSGFTFSVDNQGSIRGGGGGGGAGGGLTLCVCGTGTFYAGGNGGPGQGYGNLAGPTAGVPGSTPRPCNSSGTGGTGGAFGSAGNTGGTSTSGAAGSSGGAAGAAVNGSSKITWITTGTRTGAVNP